MDWKFDGYREAFGIGKQQRHRKESGRQKIDAPSSSTVSSVSQNLWPRMPVSMSPGDCGDQVIGHCPRQIDERGAHCDRILVAAIRIANASCLAALEHGGAQ